jgi:hypothetical protein
VTRARLARRALELLGPIEGPVAVVVPRAPRLDAALRARVRLSAPGESPAAAVVAFLGSPARPEERQRTLRDLRERLTEGARLVLVDHAQPRTVRRRILATLRLRLAGFPPGRGRYPAARELAALGFAVDRLRLECGERVQLVVARR